MVFPIGDDNSGRQTTPVVNHILIALNVLVFAFFQGLGSNDRFTYAWATVPAEIKTGTDIDRPVVVKDPVTDRVVGRVTATARWGSH